MLVECTHTHKAIETSIESYIGLGPNFLMRAAPDAPVDQVGHFQDNHQQPDKDGQVVAKKNDSNGENKDHWGKSGTQCDRDDVRPVYRLVYEPLSSGCIQ